MKLQKGSFETFIIFIISPFLSLPFVFAQLKKGNDKLMTLLLSMIVGWTSYLFIPHYTNDKTRYIERNELFKTFNFADLKEYFVYSLRPDYIFDTINFIFAKSNIGFHYFFFILTTFTVYSVFRFVRKTNDQLLDKSFNYNLVFALMVLFSFSLAGLFSGIRFILAGSVFVWAIYYLLIERKISAGVIYFAIAILTHFSFAFFIPPILLLFFWPKRINAKLILLISLVFLLLPKDILQNIFEILNLIDSYQNKADAYLTSERETTVNAQILTYLRNAWVYFSYIFILFLNKERTSQNKILLIFVIILSFINITYSVPTVFNRYLTIANIVFSAYLINSKIKGTIKNAYFYIYFLLFALHIAIDLYVLRPNLFASYNIKDMLTIVNIISDKFTIKDILN